LSGKAKVLLDLSDGKQMMLAYFISGGIIGDIELMTDTDTNQSTLQAVTRLECIALPLRTYRHALTSNLTFINHIGKELAQKLRQRAVNGSINTLQPLETRLCAYISQTANANTFSEKLTEVAVMTGASYRHLLRCFNTLCAQRILEKQKKGYRIINREALHRMAGDFYVMQCLKQNPFPVL
jgi:CRP-like cAMP-binding protein